MCTGGSCGTDKTVLIYACSGGANVGEAADQAARNLMSQGCGTMFCLAGVAAGIESMVEKAKKADINLIIEGCGMDCAKRCFDNAGITNYVQLKVTEMGVEKKTKGTRATSEEIEMVAAKAKEKLVKMCGCG